MVSLVTQAYLRMVDDSMEFPLKAGIAGIGRDVLPEANNSVPKTVLFFFSSLKNTLNLIQTLNLNWKIQLINHSTVSNRHAVIGKKKII